jgi:DNA polymerase gamma 1
METNQLGYAILPEKIQQKVFGNVRQQKVDEYAISQIRSNMEKFGVEFPIKNPKSFSNLPDDLDLPSLQGKNISQHFETISRTLMQGKIDLLNKFSSASVPEPPPASELLYVPGWVSYAWSQAGWVVKQVDKLDCDIAVFDCETFVKGSSFGHPILATAVSDSAYYVWMHECFVNPDLTYNPQFVPLGTDKALLIAHNVAFDRQRTAEAYTLGNTNLWFDTMSAHINVSGLASDQRWFFKDSSDDEEDIRYQPKWAKYGSLNNLVDCYNFHCAPRRMEKQDKKTRDIFVVANSMAEMQPDREELVSYALNDVFRTWELVSKLVPKYLSSNPSPTTLCGHFAISSSVLPVVDNWDQWLQGCESQWQAALAEQDKLLQELAQELYKDWQEDQLEIDQDPWLRQLDWTCNNQLTKANKPRSKWYGVPQWVRNISELDDAGKVVMKPITTKSRISHLLLRFKWNDSPIVYVKDSGWMYRDRASNKDLKIPHYKKEGANVGGILSKEYLPEFESGVLSSDLPQAKELIRLAINVAYWTSVRSRVLAQLPVQVDNKLQPGTKFNLIVPATVPHNTSTNRAGERLWLTVPDPKYDKIGSEIKTRVQAPAGYTFVQSDFDAQEAVVASIFADSYHKVAGSSQLSHSILAGSKDDGTDMHSVTARTLGMPSNRGVAKGCNYAMLYGCGAKTLADTIRQGNKSIPMTEAMLLGKKLIRAKKGVVSPMTGSLVDGSDSFAYNVMAAIADSACPVNPLSGTLMSTAFRPETVNSDFWTMRNNWCIQSTGSAMLHGFVTAMVWLCQQHNLDAKFCMAVHDSVLYMCPEDQAVDVARMFQVAHVWCWSWLRFNFGIYEMPVANAWLSSIEIDRIFRKSATSSTLTVSQTQPEPDGKSYTMLDLW